VPLTDWGARMTTDAPDEATPLAPPASRFTSGLVGAAALIAVITVFARVVGFARIVVFARAVGPATCLGNSYFTANTVPNIVFEIVAGGALASLVVPVLAGPVERRAEAETSQIVSALLTWTLLILTPISVVGIWLVHPVMHALVGDSGRCSPTQVIDVGARMLLVFLPQIVLYGIGIVLSGALQAHRRFAGPALAPLLSSLVVIATYLTFAAIFSGNPDTFAGLSHRDQLVLSVGTTLGVAALTLSLLVPFRRTKVRVRLTTHFPHGVAQRVRALAFAGVATLVAQELAVAVVLRLANNGGPRGAVTVYNLAWTVFLLPWAVLAVPLATSAFPRMSASASDRDDETFADVSSRSTRVILLVTFAASAVLIGAAQPIANVLARHGPGATASDVHSLARAIAAFAPGLVGYGLVANVGRALYARNRGRAAALATVAGWMCVIVADIALVATLRRADTVAALALGNSVGMSVAGALLLAALAASAPKALRHVGRAAATSLIASIVAAGAGLAIAHAGRTPSVPANIGLGLLVALATILVFVMVAAVGDREALRDLRDRAPRHA
jgi:putative peptidoglycan lipid II flippase